MNPRGRASERSRACRWALLLVLACLLAACGAGAPKTVVLIGGPASEGAGRHAYPEGIRQLQAMLEQDAPGGVRVNAYPHGWPSDPAALRLRRPACSCRCGAGDGRRCSG